MSRRKALSLVAALFLAVIGGSLRAHEVRPGFIRITEDGAHRYTVLWKRPVVGEMAVRLIPHLSNGWLEREPSRIEVTTSFAIEVWSGLQGDSRSLEGQSLSVEGIQDTITDVFVEVSLSSGQQTHQIINARTPDLVLHCGGGTSIAVPAYLTLGISHILMGGDHLLFVLGLLLLVTDRWKLTKTITCFTVGHSCSLGAAALGYATVRPELANALIAFSIFFLGPEIVRIKRGGSSVSTRYPWVVAFAFGLLHGLGFASGLTAVGLPASEVPLALLLFNVGVEIGQLTFIALALAMIRSFQVLEVRWPRPVTLLPTYAIGVLGAFWTIQRVFILLGGAA